MKRVWLIIIETRSHSRATYRKHMPCESATVHLLVQLDYSTTSSLGLSYTNYIEVSIAIKASEYFAVAYHLNNLLYTDSMKHQAPFSLDFLHGALTNHEQNADKFCYLFLFVHKLEHNNIMLSVKFDHSDHAKSAFLRSYIICLRWKNPVNLRTG